MLTNTYRQLRPVFLIVFCLYLFPTLVKAEKNYEGELILFPFFQSQFNSNLDPSSVFDDDKYDYGVDIFTTLEYGKFRFLGEALLSRHSRHVERLQLGWLFDSNHRLWLGRFHNPLGFWNTNYHHGDYLESAISRPSIVEFEHDGGILPLHLAGILYEGKVERGESGLGYVLAVAAGNELSHHGLEGWDPISPGTTEHDINITANFYYEPELLSPDRFGIFASYSEIPAEHGGLKEIRQSIAGAYINWESEPWHVISSVYYIHNKLKGPIGGAKGGFLNAYLQLEYDVNENWRIFARFEETTGDRNDAYLALFPEFIRDRLIGGIRVDFLEQHALKLQVSNNHVWGDDFYQVALQWSAVF